MRLRLLLTGVVLLAGGALPASAAPAPDDQDEARVTLTPPQGNADGKLVIVFPKGKLLKEVHKSIPESVTLPDQKLGNQLIYRDVQLNDITAADLKPSSLTLDGGVFRVAGTPTVKGNLNAQYEHVVVTTEVRTIGKIWGREVKQSVPVTKSEWRPKGAAPFTIKLEVRGTCKVSFTGKGPLKDQHLRLETQADYVRITNVELKTDDLVYKAVKELVGVVGKALPNEGLNKPIKDALTQSFDVDPFKSLSQKERDQLGQFEVKKVTTQTTDSEVTVSADLAAR
jgi:hypothetical protein